MDKIEEFEEAFKLKRNWLYTVCLGIWSNDTSIESGMYDIKEIAQDMYEVAHKSKEEEIVKARFLGFGNDCEKNNKQVFKIQKFEAEVQKLRDALEKMLKANTYIDRLMIIRKIWNKDGE